MKILVTGGTGVVGEGAVLEILKAGHRVRLLSRGAGEGAREWPGEVEPYVADIGDPATLRGAADGCDAVLHITGIVEEDPPEATFERVNVEGTHHVLAEAERAGAKRFVYVSSLGAERGTSDYHRSKHRAEEIVRSSSLDWVIVRIANVYGPGDEVISLYLKLFRTLPAIPIVGDGNQPFQPIWYRDVGRALARSVEMPEVSRRTLEVAGADVTSMNDLADRFERITSRTPARLPIPEAVASAGIGLAEMLGADEMFGVGLPINHAKLRMLVEENVVHDPKGNALVDVFGVEPTPLERGLWELADAIPEQLPTEGYGGLEHKRFWADVVETPHSAARLLDLFRERCTEVMPIEFSAEPGAARVVELGTTFTMNLPMRGNVQVRVAESDDENVTFVTLEGHPLAGIVRFTSEPHGAGVRFAVDTYTRPATVVDYVAMKSVGSLAQAANWAEVVRRVVELGDGTAPDGVETETEMLEGGDADQVERWIRDLVVERKRETKDAELKK